MPQRLFGVLLLFFSPALAFGAEVMFEGYYRVDLGGKHIGYTIQRYEFEPKDKTFQATSFMRVKIDDKIVQESTKAKANDKFQPISYQYTSQVGDQVKAIDTTFKGELMTVKTTDGKKVTTQNFKNPKGTFISSFLIYLMLQKPLEINQAFQYSAVAEEDGGSYNGKALIESKESRNGLEVLRILNSYKGDKFIAHVAIVKDAKDPKKIIRGEMIGTSSPIKNLKTELVASANLATENQIVPNKTLIALFGSMPTGKANLIAGKKETTEPAVAPAVAPPAKAAGVPATDATPATATPPDKKEGK